MDPADAPALRYDSQSKQVLSSSPEGRCRIQRRVSRWNVFVRPGVRKNEFFLGRARARSSFSGGAFLSGASPAAELSISRMRARRISAPPQVIRKYDYRDPCTSRFTVPSRWNAQSSRMSIVNSHAPPFTFPTRGMLTSIIALRVTCYISRQFFFIKTQFFTIVKGTRA